MCVASRILHGTGVLPFSDPQLFPSLVSLLFKMFDTPILPPSLLDPTRGYFESRRSFVRLRRVRLRKEELSIQLCRTPHRKVSIFRLIQDYGVGRDGQVWLVASRKNEKGQSFIGVLKTLHFDSDSNVSDARGTQLALQECLVWRDVLKSMGMSINRVVPLAASQSQLPGLLMPFAFHIRAEPSTDAVGNYKEGKLYFSYPDHRTGCSDPPPSYFTDVDKDELHSLVMKANEEVMQVAEEAIDTIANAGYEHNDVELRHVAFLVERCDGSWKRYPLLIDLTDVKKLDPNDADSRGEAAMRMKDNLYCRYKEQYGTHAPVSGTKEVVALVPSATEVECTVHHTQVAPSATEDD